MPHLLLIAAFVLACVPARFAHAASGCSNGQLNPVVVENCLTDPATWSTAWRADRKHFIYDTRVLGAYASRPSVNRGESISFYVRSSGISTFSISFYRLGWYSGTGGRVVASVRSVRSILQPACRWQNPETIDAYFTCSDWRASYSLTVPEDWVSGIYLASIRSAALKERPAYAHDVIFVVRDDQRRADFVYQVSMATEQAYNAFHYGPALYSTQSINGHTVPIAKASFERPFDALDNLQIYRFELPFVFWMESQGYDTVYMTDIDTHERAGPLAGFYKAFILSGHSEYWSRPMYDAVETARNSGIHLGFFGGNVLYWQMRLEDEAANPGDSTHYRPDRVMVVFRHPYPPEPNGLGDPNPNPALQTINWRDFPLMRDEEALVGVHFTHPVDCPEHVADWASYGTPPSGGVPQSAPKLISLPQALIVADANAWPYDGTGLRAMDTIPSVYGQEADAFETPVGASRCGRAAADAPARLPAHRAGTLSVLASSSFTYVNGRLSPIETIPTQVPVNSVIYQACSSAWVFAAGDIMWGDALAPAFILGDDYTSGSLQQLAANVMDVFAGRKSVASGGGCVGSFPTQLSEIVMDALSD